MQTYELAIVGGGPAGLSTALHLAAHAPRLAARTVVLERARYPREKYCAGAIGQRALDALAQIGIDLDLGGAVPAQRIDGFWISCGGARVSVREPGAAWVIRRQAFDARLASETERRGVELRQGARVRTLARDPRGVTLTFETGEPIRARAVVGADGITGVVRNAIGLSRGVLHAQAVETDTERVAEDPPPDTLHFLFRPELPGYLWNFPTPLDGRVMMSRGAYLLRDRRTRERADPQQHLRGHLARAGLDRVDHPLKQLAERGLDPRQPISVPRAILVGEAAGIDFPTGEGIAQAILHGELAARYLVEALAADRLGFDDWRARWLRTGEGRFLRRRLVGGRALYSSWRPMIERALGRSPAVVRLVLRRFAGRSVSPSEIVSALAQLGGGLARELVRSPRR